jgi:FtsZ-interacting cell division protein ZipA
VLVAVIWAFVAIGAALLIIGFLTSGSNILLILAIVFAVIAMILVLGSWARRAKEATTAGFDDTIAFGGASDDDEGDELYSKAGDDTAEEFTLGSRRDRPERRPAARKSGAKPAAKPKAKPKASGRSGAKPTRAKSTASKATAKRKPTRRSESGGAQSKPKPKPTSRPKAKPPRRRPPTQ